MDYIVKFTIGLFIFSILLLFFKSTKKLSENYYRNSMISEKDNKKIEKKINVNEIKWKIK